MDTNYETIKKMLEGLLNLTQERGATSEEAYEAARKAQFLASKYQIDLEKLQAQGKIEVGYEQRKVARAIMGMQLPLLSRVMRTNLCRFVLWPMARSQGFEAYTVLGKKHNIDIAIYLYDAINNCLRQMGQNHYEKSHPGRQAWKRDGKDFTGAFWAWYESFYIGAITEIMKRLVTGAVAAQGNLQEKGLVLRADSGVEMAFRDAFPSTRNCHTPSGKITDLQAYATGTRVGASLAIGQGIEPQGTPAGHLRA